MVLAQDPLADPELDLKNKRFETDPTPIPWAVFNETWQAINAVTECSTSAIPRYPFRDFDKGARDVMWRSMWAGESAAVLPLGYPLFIGAAFGCLLKLLHELLQQKEPESRNLHRKICLGVTFAVTLFPLLILGI